MREYSSIGRALARQLDYPRQIEAAARRTKSPEEADWLRSMGLVIPMARTFVWAEEVVPLLAAGAATLRDVMLYPDMIPEQHGFVLFERPIDLLDGGVVRPDTGELVTIDALLWGVHGNRAWINSFVWGAEPHYPDLPSLPCMPAVWEMGEPLELSYDRAATQTSNPVQQEVIRRTVQIFAAMLLFLGQRILVTRQARPMRSIRRRSRREEPHFDPVVRVVELRRKEARDHSQDAGDPVDWHCRWLVSGHWRQQWFPSQQRHQPVWITPYVKGPDDKPLKEPGAKVFAVVR